MSVMKLLDFQEERREYLKTKLNYLETNSTTKTVRDLWRCLNAFQKGHQPRTNLERWQSLSAF